MKQLRSRSGAMSFRRAITNAGLVAFAGWTIAGCTQLTAGKSYILAKADDSGYLREASRIFVDGNSPTAGGWDQPVKGNLEIRLGDYFVKYIASLDLPEVVLFSRVTIRDPSSTEKESGKVVYERILMNTESDSDYSTANQGAGSAMRDVVLLPAIQYEQQDITVSIRLIELDQNDNARYKALLSAVAATTASFQPEATLAISAAQAALGFFLANNPDDLEFTYDFGLSPATGETIQRVRRQIDQTRLPTAPATTHDLVLQPRVGTLAVLKTELPDRVTLPTDKISLVADGVRWTAMSAVKLGTLNLLNWYNEDKDYDRYTRAFGQPLQPSFEAMDPPAIDSDGYVYHVDYYPLRSLFPVAADNPAVVRESRRESGGPLRGEPWRVFSNAGTGKPKRLRVLNGGLYYDDGDSRTQVSQFFGKSYLTLSITSPPMGVPVSDVSKLTDTIKDLGIRTTQLSPAEFSNELAKVTDALQHVAVAQNAKSDGNRQIASATSLADAAGAAAQTLESLCSNFPVDGKDEDEKKKNKQVRDRYVAEVRRRLEQDLERKEQELCKISILRPVNATLESAGSFDLTIQKRESQIYKVLLIGPDGIIDGKFAESTAAVQFADLHFPTTGVSATAFPAGDYQLRLLPQNENAGDVAIEGENDEGDQEEEKEGAGGEECTAKPKFPTTCHQQQTIPLKIIAPAPQGS